MSHLARAGQPTENEAADAYIESGTHRTSLQKVADFIIATGGAWFNNADVDKIPGVGIEARKRRRELGHEYGWEFESRRVDKNTWQFRVVSIPDEFEYTDLGKRKRKS